MVGADRDRLEGGQGKGGSKGRRRSDGAGGAGVDGLGLVARSRHTGGDCGRHQVGGVPGGKRLQWSGAERSGAEWSGVERSGAEWGGVERGGGLTYRAGTLKA